MEKMLSPETAIFVRLADLLEYPRELCLPGKPDFPDQGAGVGAEIQKVLELFYAWRVAESLERAQEVFTATFDVHPICVPYVSVYLFGEENFKRSELMAGLARAYAVKNFDSGLELDDHIAVLLRYRTHAEEAEWTDLKELCLKDPVSKMTEILEKQKNPYQHVMRAVQTALKADFAEGRTDA